MSRQVALDNINLRAGERWGHTEYSLGYHEDYIRERAGKGVDGGGAVKELYRQWSIDLNWSTNDGLINWGERGRVTDMGHASYASDGHDQTAVGKCPFKSMEEVWALDAVEEYGLPERAEQIDAYQKNVDLSREKWPDQLTTGGYYKTLVSGAIETFGWDMFLMGLSDPGRMEPVLDSFFRRTLFHMECWAQTDVEVIIQHDDFVWSEGAFMHPDIYRKMIIPRYTELWKVLHAAGKKVLFCSDANFMEFAGDIAEAGADGMIFEPMTDFEFMVERFGSSHCLVGSCVDCRDLTLGHRDKALADMERTFKLLEKCRGAIVATGNHLPPNIPAEMMDMYINELLPRLARMG